MCVVRNTGLHWEMKIRARSSLAAGQHTRELSASFSGITKVEAESVPPAPRVGFALLWPPGLRLYKRSVSLRKP
jgi:hypothetical protein